MLRLLVLIAFVGALAFCGATVKLGNRTFFGHVRAIWATDEAKDLKTGVKNTAAPAANKLKRGIEAGYNAMKEEGSGAGSGSGSAQSRPAAKKKQ